MGRHGAISSCRLGCSHTAWFTPEPELGDIVFCWKCLDYRSVMTSSRKVIVIGSIDINTGTREVTIGDIPIHLNRLEYEVLEYLAIRRGHLVTWAELLREIWHRELDPADIHRNSYKLVNAQVTQLRRKLNDMGDEPKYLYVIRGWRGTGGVRLGGAPAIVTSP